MTVHQPPCWRHASTARGPSQTIPFYRASTKGNVRGLLTKLSGTKHTKCLTTWISLWTPVQVIRLDTIRFTLTDNTAIPEMFHWVLTAGNLNRCRARSIAWWVVIPAKLASRWSNSFRWSNNRPLLYIEGWWISACRGSRRSFLRTDTRRPYGPIYPGHAICLRSGTRKGENIINLK